MNRFDVIVDAIRRRHGRRRPFEIRWRATGRPRSKSFTTRALADSYRAELVRAARKGLEFDPQTGEPVLWAEPEPLTVTWHQHAAAYAAMKWPTLAAHSRASVAEALATVTPALTRAAPARPPAAQLRTAQYQHAFNPARTTTADPATTRVLAWAQQRGLKHRPEGSVRTVPIPPVLVAMLRHHLRCYGTAPDGCLFRGTRGGPLSESSYGRTWHIARGQAFEPGAAATSLARRPYDLRHAALSLWLNAGAAPAQIARRAGHSITVLLAVYAHCIDGQDDITNRQIEQALHTRNQARHRTANGSADRRYRPDPVRHMSVPGPHSPARAAACRALRVHSQNSPLRSPTIVSAAQSISGGQRQPS